MLFLMLTFWHRFNVTGEKDHFIHSAAQMHLLKFSCMLFNTWVTPWINQSTLNASMTTWRGCKRIYLSHIHFAHVRKWNVLTHDDMRFRNNWIFEHFIKCTWISSGLCRHPIYHLDKREGERQQGTRKPDLVCIWHKPRPPSQSMVSSGNASQI